MQPRKQYWLRSLIFLVIFSYGSAFGSDSLQLDIRKKIVVGGNIAAYSGLMSGLYFLWYSDYPMSKFHLLNDNKEWLQMDKAGHSFSCYYEGVAGIKMMKWAGYTKKQSAFIGGSYGFFIQTGVEALDGFSDGWGASWGDMTANAFGAGLAISQDLLWEEQRVSLKFSYSPSPYAKFRPNTLGANFPQRLLKDYNAQTYWLSGNIKAFAPDCKIPDWLNIAVGYGADGMYGGFGNTFTSNGIDYDFTSTPRSRQFYIAPDIDLTKIKTHNKLVKTGLIILNGIKFPLPTLEYHTTEGFKAHLIQF
jgi:uncharacterized protein YfiM (DUF2279 family)